MEFLFLFSSLFSPAFCCCCWSSDECLASREDGREEEAALFLFLLLLFSVVFAPSKSKSRAEPAMVVIGRTGVATYRARRQTRGISNDFYSKQILCEARCDYYTIKKKLLHCCCYTKVFTIACTIVNLLSSHPRPQLLPSLLPLFLLLLLHHLRCRLFATWKTRIRRPRRRITSHRTRS